MSVKSDILRLIKAYTGKTQSPSIDFETFMAFVTKFVPRHEDELKDLAVHLDSLRDITIAVLIELSQEKTCLILTRDGRPDRLFFGPLYHERLEREFARTLARPDLPFPNEENLKIDIPANMVIAVDIKTDFINYIDPADSSNPDLVRIMFPDGIRSMLVNSRIIGGTLLDSCVQKIRVYLRAQKNASYMQQKLMGLFRGREQALRDMFNIILTRSDHVVADIQKPTEFTFLFWAQLSSMIIKEFAPKKDRLEEEHGFCQSAYIIGFYIVYRKGKAQKERETDSALKFLDQALNAPPFAFSINDLYMLKDTRGIPLSKKIETRFINERIGALSTPPDEKSLPEIIRIKSGDGGECFARKANIARILVERTSTMAEDFRTFYINRWHGLLLKDEEEAAMRDDGAFNADLETRIREREPLLAGILNYSMLFIVREQLQLSPAEQDTLNRLLDLRSRRLAPMAQFLSLDRKQLLADARLLLPFWMAVPILSVVFKFLNSLLFEQKSRVKKQRRAPAENPAADTGTEEPQPATRMSLGPASERDGQPAGTSPTRKIQQQNFRDAMAEMKDRILGPGADMRKEMRKLIDEWNHLIDETAKKNLVEDVNSLVRDFLRRLKITSRLAPPDLERIRNLARELTNHNALGKIRAKEPLRRYIELYMIELLSRV